MNKLKRITAILCLLCFATNFYACNDKVNSADFYYFNTEIHVQVDGSLKESTQDEIKNLLSSLHTSYRLTDSNDSFSAQFNALASGESMTVTNEQADLLEKCKEYYEFTQGKFNPAVYPLVELWKFAPSYPVQNFTPPTDYDCKQIVYSKITDFENGVIVDGNKVTKPLGDTKIDLGGIVKGVASDQVGKILKDAGHQEGYVNVGGSSLYLLKTDSLGITHPRGNGQIINVTQSLSNVSVSTSGDYQKYYDYDGERYSHIISGYDGLPAHTGVQSATIICPDGVFADAISTALCLCEYQGNENDELIILMKKILQKYPSASLYVVVENEYVKTIVTNKEKGENFTLLDSDYNVFNI